MTVRPSRVAHSEAPTSPRSRKFFSNSSATAMKRASQLPSILPFGTSRLMVSMWRAYPRSPWRSGERCSSSPPRAGLHAELLASLGFADALEVAPPPEPAAPARELRVVAWNAQRGTDPARGRASSCARRAPALFLLSEVDVGMARSRQAHVPRELAARLGCGFAFAVEFLELGLGDAGERATLAGQENALGWHGGAVLARQALVAPAVARLEPGGRWFDGALGERRVGSRIAVLCRLPMLDAAGRERELALASVHLESHSDPDERAAQLEAVFDALERLAPGAPALVGGDVNTHSLGRAELEDRDAPARARSPPIRAGSRTRSRTSRSSRSPSGAASTGAARTSPVGRPTSATAAARSRWTGSSRAVSRSPSRP